MTQLAEQKQYSADEYVPAALWGKDHWSTLAYVESVATDCSGFQVGVDGRMRSNRRHFRVMHECPKPRRAGRSMVGAALASDAGTRLNDGQVIAGHDDWCCLQDMAQEGLFNVNASGIQPGFILHLSAKGQAWCAALRAHKQAGGMFHDVDVSLMPQVDSEPPKDAEVFNFMGLAFNVTAIIEDLNAKRIRPQTATFDRAFIEHFATRLHGLRKDNPQDTSMSLMTGVRAVDVHSVPDSAFEKPLILAYAGKNKGVLSLDETGAHYLLIDGNKRLGKAFFDDRESLEVVVLNQAQTRKYKL